MIQISRFYSFASPLSPFRFTKFTHDGDEYTSLEQFIQAKKAAQFEDDMVLKKIMLAKFPYEARELATTIQDFNLKDWMRAAPEIVLEGCMAKVRHTL